VGNVARLIVAGVGGWLALRWVGAGVESLAWVFAAQAVALVVYGLFNVGAVAGGAWFRGAR
jgi:hypothetical protein